MHLNRLRVLISSSIVLVQIIISLYRMSIAMLKKTLLTPNKSRRSSFGMNLAIWNQISGGTLAIACQGEKETDRQRNINLNVLTSGRDGQQGMPLQGQFFHTKLQERQGIRIFLAVSYSGVLIIQKMTLFYKYMKKLQTRIENSCSKHSVYIYSKKYNIYELRTKTKKGMLGYRNLSMI